MPVSVGSLMESASGALRHGARGEIHLGTSSGRKNTLTGLGIAHGVHGAETLQIYLLEIKAVDP